jgi:hypothetical protein
MFATYGENYFTIRGFVKGGWKTLNNADGDLTKEGPLFRLSLDEFESEILQNITEKDTIIFPIIVNPKKEQFPFEVNPVYKKLGSAKKILIVVGIFEEKLVEEMKKEFDVVVAVNLTFNYFDLIENIPTFPEFSAKLIFNAITTSTFVKNGRVFHNRMINLGMR